MTANVLEYTVGLKEGTSKRGQPASSKSLARQPRLHCRCAKRRNTPWSDRAYLPFLAAALPERTSALALPRTLSTFFFLSLPALRASLPANTISNNCKHNVAHAERNGRARQRQSLQVPPGAHAPADREEGECKEWEAVLRAAHEGRRAVSTRGR